MTIIFLFLFQQLKHLDTKFNPRIIHQEIRKSWWKKKRCIGREQMGHSSAPESLMNFKKKFDLHVPGTFITSKMYDCMYSYSNFDKDKYGL